MGKYGKGAILVKGCFDQGVPKWWGAPFFSETWISAKQKGSIYCKELCSSNYIMELEDIVGVRR